MEKIESKLGYFTEQEMKDFAALVILETHRLTFLGKEEEFDLDRLFSEHYGAN